MQERFIAAVDLGASKISLTVCNVVDGVAQVLHYREAESRGIRRGTIFNPKQVCEPLGRLIREAEEALDINIHEVVTAYPRWKVSTDSVDESCQRSEPESFISEEEVTALKDSALTKFSAHIKSGTEIYGAVAQSYSTEDLFQAAEADVIGVTGSKFEGMYKVFTGAQKPVANIDKVMNELGIASYKFFVAEAVAETVLTSDEKEHGVALVEIGAGVTSVSVYHRGVLRFFDSFPFGGNSVTSDIHLECGIQETLAENIKLGFGSCMPDRLQSLGEKIIQIHDKRTGETQQLPVKYLAEIIGSRMREILNSALFLIGKSGYADSLRGGIVLTGGGAELLSASALMTELSGLPARVGFPHVTGISTDGCPEICSLAGVSQLAMIALCRDREYINCAILKELDVQPEEPVAAPEPEPTDTVFEPEPEQPEQPSKPAQPSSPKKERKPGLFRRLTDGLTEVTGNLFDENIDKVKQEDK